MRETSDGDPRSRMIFWTAAALLMALAFVLRVRGAGGELWLDEITSLTLVSGIRSPDEVFWRINHSNNHMLNSLWVYLVGVDSSPLRLRFLSIVLGTLTVPMAGLAAGRKPLSCALAAMGLFAVSYPMVHYGSEERGYSGLILFTLMAIHALRNDAPALRDRIYLGAAMILGVLSHFTMVFTIAGLLAWQIWIEFRRGMPVDAAFGACLRRFFPGFVAIGILAAVIAVGSRYHTFIIPLEGRFTVYGTTTAYGMMLASVAGVWSQAFGQADLVITLGLLALAWEKGFGIARVRLGLYVSLVIVVPVVLFIAHGQNLNNVRYYLAFGAVYLLFLSELVGVAWQRGRTTKVIAVALVVAGAALNGYDLSQFDRFGRGHYAEAVAMMTRNGPATYGDDGGRNGNFGFVQVADYYASKQHVKLSLIEEDQWCQAPPQWLVVHTKPVDIVYPTLTTGRPACALHYDTPIVFPFWGLSGWQWTVYRYAP